MFRKITHHTKRAVVLLLVLAVVCPPVSAAELMPPTDKFEIVNGILTHRQRWFLDEFNDIIIPDGVVEIGPWAFSVSDGSPMRAGTMTVRNIIIPDSVRRIGEYAFGEVIFENVIIPDSVLSIADNAFNKYLNPDMVIPDRSDSSATKAYYAEENKDERLPVDSFICNIDEQGYITVFREYIIDIAEYDDAVQPIRQDTVFLTALLDPDYNMVLDFVVDAVWPKPITFYDDYAVVQSGSTVWKRISYLYGDLPIYTRGDGEYGVIDRAGNFVIDPEYYEIRYKDVGVFELWEDKYRSNSSKLPQVNIQEFLIPPSDWAQEDIKTAVELKLVNPDLRYWYTRPITRAEFCTLVVAVYEKLTGAEISIIDPETGYDYERIFFGDAIGDDVRKAAAIGVVNGVAYRQFDPDSPLTREQAATILARLADALDKPFDTQSSTFTDSGSVASWAIDAVGMVQSAGIMQGIGKDRFAPQEPYTREQSIVTIMRLYEYIANK